MEKKAGEERWSGLPMLLLWMVKDLLNLADNSRLASVCKRWNITSKNYTLKPQQQGIVPWLMHGPPRTTACEFVNVSTKEKLILDIPDFNDDALFWFSKQGWLLFGLMTQGCVLLYNVHNKSKIMIPSPQKELRVYRGFISSFEDGTPRRVILVKKFRDLQSITIFVQMIEVGDDTWTRHSYAYQPRPKLSLSLRLDLMMQERIYNQYKIFVDGNHVYIYHELSLTMITFDMTIFGWREVHVARNTQLQATVNFRMMLSEDGEIVQINGDYHLATFDFYRMNDGQTSWEELQYEDVIGARWYISSSTDNHLAVKETPGTNEVYILDRHGYYNHVDDDGSCIVRHAIRVYDRINGAQRKEMVEWFEFKNTDDKLSKAKFSKRLPNVYWVDLGKIEKPPASCIGTKFSVKYVTC